MAAARQPKPKVVDDCPYNVVDITKLEHRLDVIEKDHLELKVVVQDSQKMIKDMHEYLMFEKASKSGFKMGIKATVISISVVVSGIVGVVTEKIPFKDILTLFH